jgi:fructosamine-3-kinase
VPAVLALRTDGGRSFLLLEYISGAARVPGYWETFARELAGMHRAETGTKFGFETDNFIGSRKQINTPHDSWIPFFRDCRLQPQLEAAQKYFSPEDRKKAGNLLSRLDRFLTEPDLPALLHGDLWSGNMITGNDGKGWLIDPAVYYGHPEADLAMTELFGGFPARFYEAYREAGKQEPGYKDRRDLYNLYHLLNHLNLFGGMYLHEVLRVVERYV